jgi:hypothetical protein
MAEMDQGTGLQNQSFGFESRYRVHDLVAQWIELPLANGYSVAMLTTNEKGARTEGAVLSVLLHAGYNVLLPFGVARYDLVIETAGSFKRVQCKTARLGRTGNSLEFNVSSTPPGGKAAPYDGQVDYFGVYLVERGQVYLVPVEALVGLRREVTMRLGPAKNGQSRNTRDALPYLVDP